MSRSGSAKASREKALVFPCFAGSCSCSSPSGIQAFQNSPFVGSSTAAPQDCRIVMNPFTEPADAPVTMRGDAAAGLSRIASMA